MQMHGADILTFQEAVWTHYRTHGRHDLPWRAPEPDGSFDPYKILVSEIMLQQTQVNRVLPKFLAFTDVFPSVIALAAAPLGDVLKAWSGLGYNRRAKFLWEAVKIVATTYNNQLPDTGAALVQLPGIGANTAGAVLAYAFNKPVIFIETNIRTVYIHHFFSDRQGIHDREIAGMVAATLPDNPREWYWALMDYGAHLKQAVGNLSRGSVHYAKQSKFTGSQRQIRGQVLKMLAGRSMTRQELAAEIIDQRLGAVLADLRREGMIRLRASRYML